MGILKSAGVADSIDALRRSASAGGRSGRSAQLFLKSDSSVKVRFLQEPTEGFMQFLEHYDEERKAFVPAIDDDPLDNHPNERTRRASKRWLANVLNVEDGRVSIVKLNQDQVNRLLSRYARYGTLLDRNYELIRNGSGRDSRYDVDSDDPTQMDVSRFSDRIHDLTEYLLGEVDEYHQTTYQADYRASKGKTAEEAPAPAPSPAPVDLEARKAANQAKKVAELDEKYGDTPPWDDGEDKKIPPATPPAAPVAATPAPGMAEIAAETEAAAAVEDPWAEAKKNGQPCVQGDDDKCAICGFPVDECLMAK